jgi:hypothetical protein
VRLKLNDEAFHLRKNFGFWAQGGGSVVTQVINRALSSQTLDPAIQGTVRAGLGIWVKNFEVESFWRQKVFDVTKGFDYQPRWLSWNLGYNFELPRMLWGSVKPFFRPFVGLELYKNSTNIVDVKYLGSYFAPTFGFRSRFALKSRFETGGDFLFTTIEGVTKFFIQGDIRYWLTPRIALGGGYWVDTAQQTATGFRETTVALEGYLRYTY